MIEYIIIAAAAISLIRVALGPTIYDRVVAIDTFLILIIALLALWSQNSPLYLDIAIVFAGLSFGATLVFSKYLRGEKIWS
ncbi:MAG: cation:proton antiporter [archaeon]|nr:MAG: cation:proton antiporter [archaeon]